MALRPLTPEECAQFRECLKAIRAFLFHERRAPAGTRRAMERLRDGLDAALKIGIAETAVIEEVQRQLEANRKGKV